MTFCFLEELKIIEKILSSIENNNSLKFDDFNENEITNPDIKERIDELGNDLIRISEALS